MPTINDLRQQAATIKNATQVGENTATRVGTTFETIADLLEGASVGQGVPSVDLSQLNALRTPADQTTTNPTIYNVTTLHNLSSTTIKVGTLFIFSDGGRAVVTQILLSNYQVDGGGNISSPNTSQITMYYRMFNIVQETWSAWTLYAGGGGGGTIDPYPVSGSDNAVASNGVFDGLQKAAPEVNINDLDDLGDFVDMRTGESSVYTLKYMHTQSSTWLRVGVVMCFANQAQNTLTQIVFSNCVVDGGGNLIPNSTTNVMNIYYRFKQFSGNPPDGMTIGVWTRWAKFGDSGYQPDNEDINLNASDQLQFANKLYDVSSFSGLGRVYLRKNIVTSGGTDKNVFTQAMVNTANTIYHIQYDYDLNGQTITLPAGCVLEFDGGSVKNGEIDLSGGVIQGDAKLGVPLLNAGNSSIHLSWFKGVTSDNDAADNAVSSMFASANESKVLDGDNVALSLSKTIEFGDGKGIVLKNLYIEFSASANGQSMFLFNEENNYAGSFALIENCTFVQTNSASYSNVHCLHLRDYSNTSQSKISNVFVKNFSGFMFLCESYLQEMEFEFFKGSIVGGFISFNKEYGTADAYGDFGAGSSNVLSFNQCGIDDGLNTNSTIADVFDVTKMIFVSVYSVVIQGTANGRNLRSIWNFTSYDDMHTCNVVTSNCWSEISGNNKVFLGKGVNIKCKARFARQYHFKGTSISLELQLQAFTVNEISSLFQIDNGVYPKIIITDGSGLAYAYKIIELYRNVANVIIDSSRSSQVAEQPNCLYYAEGTKQDLLDNIFSIPAPATEKLFVYEGRIKILRQKGLSGTGQMHFYYGDIYTEGTQNNYFLSSPKKKAFFHLIYRVYPRVSVTSENLTSFNSAGITNSPSCLQGARYNPFVVGQSTDPNDNIWREVLTPVKDSITSYYLFGYLNYGLDIAVSEIIDGAFPFDTRISIDPNDATKLIYLNKEKVFHGTTDKLPVPSAEMAGLRYFDDTKMLPITWDGEKWRGNNGHSPAHTFGTTANRPTSELKSSDEGFQYFDTTLWRQLFMAVDFNTILISATAPKRDKVVVNNTMVKGETYRITTIDHTWNYVDVWLSKNQTVEEPGDVRLVRLPAQSAVFTYDFIMQYDASEYPYVIIDSKDGSKDLPVEIYSGNIVWKEIDGAAAGVSRSGTFANKPSSADVYVGFRYFCTDKQTSEGATDGIEIICKGNDVWVDALGRVVS